MAAIQGDTKKAMEIQFKLMPVHKQLFIEPNPIPVKWALLRMGRCGGALRLPLTPLGESGQKALAEALHSAGLV
jgi:4-hydroxy-tetrahydrodipicolinate synthase